MKDLLTLETELNLLTSQGKILEALEQFYAPEASFQEGNALPKPGKQNHHDFLSGFFATLKSFNGATLHAQAVGENVTMSEWTFDLTGPEGPILWNEVLRRQWKDGKVVFVDNMEAGGLAMQKPSPRRQA